MKKALLWMLVGTTGTITFLMFGTIIITFLLFLAWLLLFAWAVGMPIAVGDHAYQWFKRVDNKQESDES